jgi:spore coat polysaccharide biosynthesis protein SpsF
MKTSILITARLKSTRLPLKVTKMIHGKEMIVHMLDRLKLAHSPEDIIICTSGVAQDDPLVEIACREGVKYFRGDPDDVLLRLTEAAETNNVDLVINCTADNPFVDPIYIDRLQDYHISQQNEFSKIDGLPWGTFSYAISTKALRKACGIKNEKDTEVWHGYFMETNKFKWGSLKVDDPAILWPTLRLTVDEQEDFDLVTKIFDELYSPGNVFSLAEIVKLCRNVPELPNINKHVNQKAHLPIKIIEDTSKSGII